MYHYTDCNSYMGSIVILDSTTVNISVINIVRCKVSTVKLIAGLVQVLYMATQEKIIIPDHIDQLSCKDIKKTMIIDKG